MDDGKEPTKVVVVYADGTEEVFGDGGQSVMVVAAEWKGTLIRISERSRVESCMCPICQTHRNGLAEALLRASETVLGIGHEDDKADEGEAGGGCTGCDLCGMPGQPDGEHVYRGSN